MWHLLDYQKAHIVADLKIIFFNTFFFILNIKILQYFQRTCFAYILYTYIYFIIIIIKLLLTFRKLYTFSTLFKLSVLYRISYIVFDIGKWLLLFSLIDLYKFFFLNKNYIYKELLAKIDNKKWYVHITSKCHNSSTTL